MIHRLCIRSAAAFGIALAALPGAAHADRADYNRTMGSSHEPTVSRTDFVLDLAGGPSGLGPGETQRLDAWFDGLALGYGDTVAVADRGGSGGDRTISAVGAVLSRYGMLLSPGMAPVDVGHATAGSVRVVVSRAVARVDGCPNWSRGSFGEYEGANTSNFGCATAQNLAASIANPQDLVEGAHARPGGDPAITVKAVGSWRAADNSGKSGLKAESSRGAGGK